MVIANKEKNMNCPCGSQKNYSSCCGLYINGHQQAPTPECLMRSRYTAYSQANIRYIKKTMMGTPLIHFNELEAEYWAKRVHWLSLHIIKTSVDPLNETIGFVEFIARYLEHNQLKTIHELSEFQQIKDCWFYTEGHHQENSPAKTIKRNTTCPCGSQKKFKNCHG